MKKHKYAIIVSVAAALYWVAESLLHIFVFLDPDSGFIPSDINEIWMRSTIIVLMIVFGIYMDIQTEKLLSKEREKHEIFVATVSSSQHILNNLLNQMQLVLFENKGTNVLDDETRKLMKQALTEGKEQVIRLSSVAEMDSVTIRKSVAS